MTAKPLDLVDPKSIEHLFDVAIRLFAERGVDGVSVREISRVSNISIAAIYYHFKSKEGLFAEVCLHKYEDFEREILKRVGEGRPGSQNAVTLALAFFDLLTEDNNLLRLLQRDMITGTPARSSFLCKQQYQHFRRIIDKALDFDPANPDSAMKSFSFGAVINGYSELVMANIDDAGEEREQYLANHRDYLAQFVKIAFAT